MAALSAQIPGGLAIMARAMRSRRLRQLPIAFGRMSKREIPDAVFKEWLRSWQRREIRRDLRKYAGDTNEAGETCLRRPTRSPRSTGSSRRLSQIHRDPFRG
jgi:hypothetical protein